MKSRPGYNDFEVVIHSKEMNDRGVPIFWNFFYCNTLSEARQAAIDNIKDGLFFEIAFMDAVINRG